MGGMCVCVITMCEDAKRQTGTCKMVAWNVYIYAKRDMCVCSIIYLNDNLTFSVWKRRS